MTMPLSSAAALTQRGSLSAEFGDRVDQLQQAHPWMPDDMTTQLAASPSSTSELGSIADSIKTTLANTWNGFTENFNDNVLHKQPSTALTLARFLNASLGPLPIRQDDMHVIQRNLQKAGFGQDLQVNGVWDAGWNGAYNSYASNLYTRQLAGDKPGSISTAHAGHSIFSALLPSHVVNAAVGFAKGLANGVNTLLGDVAGDIVDVPYLLTGHTQQSAAANSTRAWFQNIGGGNLTAEDVAKQNEIKRVTADVGTMLALVPVAGEGSAALNVARGAWEGGVSREFAQRGPGVIAQSLGGLTAKQAAEGAARRGLLNTRVFSNIPLLRQAGPVVGRLADADGLYYKTRTLLATPYALPQVRVAGALGQRYMIAGAGLNLAAGIAPHVGLDMPLTQSIRNTNVMDTIDLNLGRIVGAPGSHAFSRALDSLGFVLHGPLGATTASSAIGDHVQAATDSLSDFIGHYNAEGAWENAASKATGTKTRIADLHAAFGGEDYFNRFMAAKLADLAEAHYAQNTAQKEGLIFGSDRYRARIGELADEVWNNPDLHTQAVKELLADPVELENRVAWDMLHNKLHPREYNPDTVEDFTAPADVTNYGHNGIAWMNQGSALSGLIRTGGARYLFGSDGKAVIANAQDNFDHGFGMDAPVRLSTTTRRAYVTQVSDLYRKVARQVDTARTKLGQAVAAAETNLAAENTPATRAALNSAKTLQAAFEQAIDKNNLSYFTDLIKKSSVQATRREWERLVKDTGRLRMLVDQGTTDRLTLRHILEHGVNPDELYTNVNGEPRIPDQAIGSGDWMRQHLQHASGSLTLARNDYKTAQEAAADIGRLQAKLDAAGRDPEKIAAVVEAAKNYGFHQFGMTERTLGVFDQNPQKLLDVLTERAQQQASMVFHTYDMPDDVRAQLQAINDGGYKVVLGSHVGHLWDSSLPPMPDLKGHVGWKRRVAGAIGVTPEQVSSRAAGQDASIRVLREVHQATLDPRYRAPARTTADTILQVLRDKNLLPDDMKTLERVAFNLTLPFHKKGILQLAEDRGLDFPAAKAAYEAEMARALQLRDIPRSTFLKALTTPGEFSNGARWEGMDRQSANLIRRAVLRGYADRPGYIQGLSTLEDWARGGFGIGDRIAVRFAKGNALSELVNRASELPNNLVILRNRLRFTLSPFFDFRRVAKQNVKMNLDGVQPVLNPLSHMIDNGTFNKAHKFLNKLIGDPQYQGFDDADRYLHQQSVWGLYNSRHFEAYYAWEKKQAGWTDDEIRQGIRRVFEYGSSRTSGRSALERTVNTIFFPFSFEKTLLRNVGAYMIDHPQQALLLTGAITAYNDANRNSTVSQWVNDHLPVLKDMQKLNAFAHGISPGEFGGINAPLMNLFLPQQWNGGLTKSNLQRFLPVWKDFGQLIHDTREQGVIAYAAAANAADYAITLGASRDPLDPYRPTITPEAQQRHATAMRNSAILAWTDVLDYNTHQSSDASKYTFPNDPRLPASVRGKVVNRTNIGYLVKIWYPAYDPGEARRFAEQQAEKAQTYVDNLTDPVKHQQYGVFVKLADQVQGHLQRGDYDTPTAVAVMSQFRAVAANAAEHDPTFYKFYQDHYRWQFGPLEDVTA